MTQVNGDGATDCSIVVPCEISNLTTTPSACDPNTNTYSVSGQITFEDAPETGDIIVEDCNGNQVVVASAPFTSPLNYTLPNLNSIGGTCDVTAYFSDEVVCTFTSNNYSVPATALL